MSLRSRIFLTCRKRGPGGPTPGLGCAWLWEDGDTHISTDGDTMIWNEIASVELAILFEDGNDIFHEDGTSVLWEV